MSEAYFGCVEEIVKNYSNDYSRFIDAIYEIGFSANGDNKNINKIYDYLSKK